MSDAQLRALERAAQSGDPEAIGRYLAEWLRAGRRDPRRDPRVGDVVEGKATRAMNVVTDGEGFSRRCVVDTSDLEQLPGPPGGRVRTIEVVRWEATPLPTNSAWSSDTVNLHSWRQWCKNSNARVLRVAEHPRPDPA